MYGNTIDPMTVYILISGWGHTGCESLPMHCSIYVLWKGNFVLAATTPCGWSFTETTQPRLHWGLHTKALLYRTQISPEYWDRLYVGYPGRYILPCTRPPCLGQRPCAAPSHAGESPGWVWASDTVVTLLQVGRGEGDHRKGAQLSKNS